MCETLAAKYDITTSGFYRLKSLARLARHLYRGLDELRSISRSPEHRRYKFRKITNPPKKPRWVQEPINELRSIHNRVFQLLNRINRPDYVYSGVSGRSYVKNAKQHCGARTIFKTDIAKFYQSVLWTDVVRFFRSRMMCSVEVAHLLADLCTVSNRDNESREHRHLPTGSPMSEVLAYWTFAHMFDQIDLKCRQNGLRFTLFVDDIAISGHDVSHEFILEILKVIGAHGLSARKTRRWIDRPGKITGAITSKSEPVLPNRRHLNILKNRRKLATSGTSSVRGMELLRKTIGQCFEAAQLAPHLRAVARQLQSMDPHRLVPSAPPQPVQQPSDHQDTHGTTEFFDGVLNNPF